MPSIKDAVEQHDRMLAEGKGTPAAPQLAPAMPSLPSGAEPGIPGPIRGSFTSDQIFVTDFKKGNTLPGPVRSALFPVPAQSPVTKISQQITKTITNTTPGIILETNGVKNPSQTTLNLVQGSGMQITADGQGGVHLVSLAAGDGLVHGDAIWEIDPAYVCLRDDFTTGGTASGTIGESLWFMPTAAGAVSNYTGQTPNLGLLGIPNTSNTNGFTRLYHGSTSQMIPYQTSWDLLNNPGWKAIWIWKWDITFANGPGSAAFSMAKKSFYIGLGYTQANPATPRPNSFIGLRFDTDTTSPAISDTNMQFEVVMNPLGTTRVNTQGTVVSTGLTPTAGQYYRLEIQCVSKGVVTMSLNGSAPQTFTVPPYSIVGTSGSFIDAGNGVAEIGITNASFAAVPWAVGTQVTMSGLVGGNASLNGTAALLYSAGGLTFMFPSVSTIGSNSAACTASGYTSLTPWFTWGNDTEASPTASTAELYLDFFSFVWNPGVGGGAGTPDSTKPRYW